MRALRYALNLLSGIKLQIHQMEIEHKNQGNQGLYYENKSRLKTKPLFTLDIENCVYKICDQTLIC